MRITGHSAEVPFAVPSLPWPLRLIVTTWTSAVAGEAAVRFNLRLLTVLTAVFSVPDLVQGVLTLGGAASTGGRLYGGYVLALGLLELGGALLLAVRRAEGRLLILAAAAGFYPEAALGLAAYERSLLALAVFAVSAPAEAWVIWFLTHQRTRLAVAAWRSRQGTA